MDGGERRGVVDGRWRYLEGHCDAGLGQWEWEREWDD